LKGISVPDLRTEIADLQKSLDALVPTVKSLKKDIVELQEKEDSSFASLKASAPISYAYYGASAWRQLNFTIWRIINCIELPDENSQAMSDGDHLLTELQQFGPALTAQAKDSHTLKAIKSKLDPICIELQQKLTNQKANSDKSFRETKTGSLYDNLLILAASLQPLLGDK
jgi:hypothetical protein